MDKRASQWLDQFLSDECAPRVREPRNEFDAALTMAEPPLELAPPAQSPSNYFEYMSRKAGR